MRVFRKPPPRRGGWLGKGRGTGRSLALVTTLAVALVAQGTFVAPAAAATVAEPLPRAYQVDSLAEVPDVTVGYQQLALSADGSTALYLSALGADQSPVLTARNLHTGAQEVVGLDLTGASVPQVTAAAISGDGRIVAFLASGSGAADLHLPAQADPYLQSAIFVRDRLTNSTTWVPTPDLGVPASNHRLDGIALSADGRRLATRITLPLSKYNGITTPTGVLVATMPADPGGTPTTRVIGPEDLVVSGSDPVAAQPEVHQFALSGDGNVLAVTADRDYAAVMLRFDAASGARLPQDRSLTSRQQSTWLPNLDRTGRLTAFGGLGAGVVVADLTAAPTADVTLAALTQTPYVSGDQPYGPDDLPTNAAVSADGGTVMFVRAGALWTQPAQPGHPPVLASPGLDGRLADPIPGEISTYPDAVLAPAMSADASVLVFLSASTSFVDPRTSDPQPSHLYRSVPANAPPPAWPQGAALTITPGATSATVSWPAASATVHDYQVSVNGTPATTVTAPTTQALLSNLTAGATLEVAVVARDADGRASTALTGTVTLPEQPPAGDAPLSAVAGPGSRVRLQWEVSTLTGLTGYRVLRDGVALADVAVAVTTYDDLAVAADTGYTYAVAALRAGGEVRLTRNATVRIAPLSITEATANLPRIFGTPFVALGQKATFAVVGAPGFTGTADVTVRTAGSPSVTVRVDLPEQPAGQYRGDWVVPDGAVEILGAILHLADGTGVAMDRTLPNLPAPVGGLIRTTVTIPGGEPTGVRLQVWSETANAGFLTQLKANGALDVPVVPAPDHRVTTRRSDGLDGTPPQVVAVASGQVVPVAVAPYAPASLTVTVQRPGDVGLADLAVSLVTRTGTRTGRTDADGHVSFANLDAASDVTTKVHLPADLRTTYGLADLADRTVTLVAGSNALVLGAGALPTVTVHGTTTDADGRAVQATVTLRQVIDGVGTSYRAESAADGTWSAQVFGGGTPTIAAAARAGKTTPESTVDTSADHPVGLVFPAVSGYVVRPRLFVVSLDGGRTEQHLDYQVGGEYQTSVTAGGKQIAALTGEIPVEVPAGTTVTFCADGGYRGMTKACASAVTGAAPDVSITVEIHEGARIIGRVLEPDGTPRQDRTCARLEGGDKVVSAFIAGSDLQVSAPVAGSYLLTVVACKGKLSGSIERFVTVTEGQVVNLGDLRLAATNGLLQGSRSGLYAVTDKVLPGGLAHLHADIEFGNTTRAGSARLDLPAGVSIPDDGVLRDGTPVAVNREANAIVVSLPAVRSRTLDVYVRMPGTSGAELPFTMSVSADSLTEPLGSVNVSVGVLTVQVPAYSLTGTFTAVGRAPAGAHVVVRDGDTAVGDAIAGEGGRWSATVKLGTAGDDLSQHVLRAGSTVDGVALVSDPATVVVDPHAGVLESVTMSQEGEQRTFRPVDGVARFPWLWSGAKDVTIVARFSGPVTDAHALLGLTDLVLVEVPGKPNVYSVTARTKANDVGDLTITYTPSHDRPLLPVPPAPDPATALFDPANAAIEDPVVSGDTISQQFTVPAPKLGPNAQLRAKMTVQRLPDYQPDAAGVAQARATGVKVYGTSFSAGDPRAIASTGQWSGSAGAIVDLDALAQMSPTAKTTGSFARALSAAGFVTGEARYVFEWLFLGASNGDALYGAATADGKYDALNAMMDLANRCQDGEQGAIYANALQRLMQRAVQLDAYTAVAAAAGLVLAPSTLGLSVALWAVTWGVGKALEFPLNNDIDALRREMVSNQDCNWPTVIGPFAPRRTPQPDAQIDYRFDPSGYVYEGLDSRRVAGVTATLMRAPSPDGPWTPWDATPYGDVNPQLTDADGHYGWDVPEGWWKVVYTKDGYLPAESKVMKVLPPHTDVNVNLVRADLATVDKVSADGTGLTVTFSQPVRVAQALAGQLRVTKPDGTVVPGQWSAPDRAFPPAGHPNAGDWLATQLRFTGEPYTGQLKVTVDPLLQDQVGRGLAAGAEQTLAVVWKAPDTVPPQVQVTGVDKDAVYRLGAVPAPGCSTVDSGSGVATEATVTVTGGNANGVGVFTATCAGAVDRAGNAAPPVSVTFSTVFVFHGYGPLADSAKGFTKVKAGLPVAFGWQLTNASGAAVTTVRAATVTVTPTDCQTGAPVPNTNRLTVNLPVVHIAYGYYLMIWNAPRSMAGSCQTVRVDLGEGSAAAHIARFQFVR